MQPEDYAIDKGGIESAINRQGNIVLSKNYDQILQKNLELYTKFPNLAGYTGNANPSIWFNTNGDKDGTYIVSNVTPGQTVETAMDTYHFGSVTANGEPYRYLRAWFVDDDTAGNPIVGNVHDYKGASGDNIQLGLAVPNGYKLAEGQTVPDSYTLQENNNDIIIHLKHTSHAEANENAAVTETVTYTTSDGTTPPPAKTVSKTFTRTVTVDDATGQKTYGQWTGSDGFTFNQVDSPSVTGYTPDKTNIPAKTLAQSDIKAGNQTVSYTVNYAPDARKAKVQYYDTTDKTYLTQYGKDLTGVSNGHSGYTTADTLNTLKGLGYVIDSDPTNGQEIVFNADGSEQTYTVNVHHGIKTVTEKDDKNLGHDVHRTITYRISDGSSAAPSSVSDSLHFTAVQTVDTVTGRVLSTVWSNAQDFKDVASPEVKGYTPDRSTVSDKNITHDHADINETVTYTPDKQNAKVIYYDKTTGQNIEVKNLTGTSNSHTGYTTADTIKELEDNGYVLDSDEANGQEIIFDTDDAKDQTYTVVFEHGTNIVTRDKTVKQTVHYVMSDGSKAPDDNVQYLAFKQQGVQDMVTGNIDWTPVKGQRFDDVASPEVKGYTPDKKSVNGSTISPTIENWNDDLDTEVTVTYTKDDMPEQTVPDNTDDNSTPSASVEEKDNTPSEPESEISDNVNDITEPKTKKAQPKAPEKASVPSITPTAKQATPVTAAKEIPAKVHTETVSQPVSASEQKTQTELPETDNSSNSITAVLGLDIMAVAGMMGISLELKKKN